ncbi:MAG: hypothetical protein EON90_00765 [Brevundimonas sp.]|nr:MAG: hypothetical protein EON90_00765 [Brevundimonas sp.]
MKLAEDLFLRATQSRVFDGEAADHEGQAVRMYSVVTPVGPVSQYFEDGAEPIRLEPGAKLVVVGAADGNPSLLWLEVDHAGHPWVNADVVLPASDLRYLCEVGDDPHMKAPH